ncbi:head-tail connector protein [Fructobacillus fructosus]|uniref:head-tail connector protein n=1 Tax=Fructobacillus fructosus TaxID=1631 RepID=UPI0002195A94|nr:head-tail connector protein [Fructobacillus fructosus]KRN52325.1 prophage pi1 protein 38 [Fructobacillus fructosus KCTC 3544]MBC9118623.1 phage gp6-like head-tail connector protein [Fructobacillus fructosus]MBD9365100.1 phage gp6-like head-tail connector protein [Leuconostoc mesenteroides]GAP01409.1 prophage pi1 protein 38 [Fructobacillus fructosus]
MNIVTKEELAKELNIDLTLDEMSTITSLIESAKALISSAIKLNVTDEQLLKINGELYNRLIKTLATSLYYDRELTSGYSKGTMIMLTNLRSEALGVSDEV